MKLRKLSRAILLLLCTSSLVVIIVSQVQKHSLAQTPAQGLTIAANEYFCDPSVVSPCPAKNRQTIYTAPTGETLTRFQELTVPGNPEHMNIRGNGMQADIYPEIGSYWTLKTKRYTPTTLAAFPASVKAGSSTCENGGTQLGKTTVLGYTVYEYETVSPRVRMLQWLAPDLQCHSLRREMHWTDVAEPSVQIADSVLVGNQPNSIWDLPADMKEVRPQDLYHALYVSRSIKKGHSSDEAEQLWTTGPVSKDSVVAELQGAWVRQHPQ